MENNKDPYVYSNGTLKNKLNIRNSEKLRIAESDIVITRIHEYFNNMYFTPTKEFYLSLHKTLFNDIYPFAGKIRTINIEKEERVLSYDSVKYIDYTKINDELDYIFSIIRSTPLLDLSLDSRKDFITALISELWGVHPFREGNTRVSLVFLRSYLNHYGIEFNINFFKNPNTFLYARDSLVASYYENNELDITRNLSYFRKMISNILDEDIERKKKL